jgi:hypothetical protein
MRPVLLHKITAPTKVRGAFRTFAMHELLRSPFTGVQALAFSWVFGHEVFAQSYDGARDTTHFHALSSSARNPAQLFLRDPAGAILVIGGAELSLSLRVPRPSPIYDAQPEFEAVFARTHLRPTHYCEGFLLSDSWVSLAADIEPILATATGYRAAGGEVGGATFRIVPGSAPAQMRELDDDDPRSAWERLSDRLFRRNV